MDKAAVKSVLESILFLSAEPIEIAKIAKILDISEREVEDCIEELKEEYKNQKRGFIVIKRRKKGIL